MYLKQLITRMDPDYQCKCELWFDHEYWITEYPNHPKFLPFYNFEVDFIRPQNGQLKISLTTKKDTRSMREIDALLIADVWKSLACHSNMKLHKNIRDNIDDPICCFRIKNNTIIIYGM